MKLYAYFRSSASYRVRIALALKGLPVEVEQIHLTRHGGEQLQAPYLGLNPQGLVPALVDEGQLYTQSLAIIEYLDETHPALPLLPPHAGERAHVRALALAIACDIHPLNNLRVLRYLVQEMRVSEADKDKWYRHWCELGLGALEAQLAGDPRVGRFCFGDTPTLADCCLIPQIYNAQRMHSDLSKLPTLMRINAACLALPAFAQAAPEAQPEAE
ncbi:MAG: maleylacetoacetate isomerase [Pseudomonadota bacterium]